MVTLSEVEGVARLPTRYGSTEFKLSEVEVLTMTTRDATFLGPA